MKKRHIDGKPYTRTGDIIIAINPFQWFTELYTEKKRTYYSNRIVWEASDNDPRDGMEPHVYECSALSYTGLAFGHLDQSILVSGESGAGKTETVKIAMSHIASVQQGPKIGAAGDTQDLDPVVRRVVDSNPLLEAFGNASTRRNDNSSRFGKYLQLQFDTTKRTSMIDRSKSTCTLAGSKCDVYLLEKNRVCVHDAAERTYHIFYQLVAAPDSEKSKFWDGLKGTNNTSFKYIGHTDRTKIEGMSDADHFKHTVDTLALVGITGDKLTTLMRAICIVLQCGNLAFAAMNGDKDKSCIATKKELDSLAKLMGLCENDLTLAFTERTMKTRTESYKVPLKPEAAKEAADSFAKEVYGKVFLWVVNEINAATRAEDNYKDGTMTEFGIIGLLDIFGFESFPINRFEQLCINYANEKLQQKFTEDVFRAVQEEYEQEGIELALITYDDNTDVLDLIESRSGLLAMLNEECVRPKGNDQDFVQKALTANSKSPCLIVNQFNRMSFGVHHYAGKVMYDAEGFVASNQDTLPTDLEEIGEKCTNAIASMKLDDSEPETSTPGKRAPPKRQKSNLVAPTIWVKYKVQLSSLMSNLRKTNSRYIRCIKPNTLKKPVLMEHNSTIEQLRCAGVVAAVTLARSAFPNRLDNPSVRFRYISQWENKSKYPSSKTSSMTPEEALRCDCDAIIGNALEDMPPIVDKDGNKVKPYVCGRTKSYFKAGVLEYLEANRSTGLDGQAKTIQRFVRGMLARLHLSEMMGASKRQAEAEKAERERAEREARERREREERESKEKLARALAEREANRKAVMKKYNDQVEAVKRAIAEADAYEQKQLAAIEKRREEAAAELAALETSTSDEAKAAILEPKKIAAQQEKKLEEQTKMIDFLKKENTKIRKEHAKMKEKWDVVKDNNTKLLGMNEQSGNSFEAQEDVMRKVDTKNMTLLDELDDAKATNKALKDECMKKQDDYMTQAETRLEYQKTMARILTMIQDRSKEAQLVEDTVMVALGCESEAKGIMAALEAETSIS
jgi:myosin V